MSVLRKRSAWVIPAVSLLGALTLGLAGCGGDDDSPFPIGGVTQPFDIVAPLPVTAQVTGASGGGTLNLEVQNPGASGVENVQVIIPANAIDELLGLAVIPDAQSSIDRSRAAGLDVGSLVNIAELALGTVGSGNLINTTNPVGLGAPATITLELTEAQANEAASQNTGDRRLTVRQVIGQGSNAQLVQIPDATITLDPATRTLTIGNVRTTGILSVIGTPLVHFQGG